MITYQQLDDTSKVLLRPLKQQVMQSPKGRAMQTFGAAIQCTLLPQFKYLDGIVVLQKMFPKGSSSSKKKKKGGTDGKNLVEINKWKKKRRIFADALLEASDWCEVA
jgi:hypothetical protein